MTSPTPDSSPAAAADPVAIDPLNPGGVPDALGPRPYNEPQFRQLGVLDAWARYGDRLTFGRGQCLAILDDGCDVTVPQWRAALPWGPKVIATWNAFDGNEDCRPGPLGYHGTSVGFPSSLNHENVRGVAYNNSVAHVRAVSTVHLREVESASIAAALHWVIAQRERLNITTVNLAPVDDLRHRGPVPTAIDQPLRQLRDLGVWVSAPCGNHDYTDGFSWPACAEHCFAIGATKPQEAGEDRRRQVAHLDRYQGVDLLAAAAATSSSNAYAAASAMVLREAVQRSGFRWRSEGDTLADALLAIFRRTGVPVPDSATGQQFVALDLAAALDYVMGG